MYAARARAPVHASVARASGRHDLDGAGAPPRAGSGQPANPDRRAAHVRLQQRLSDLAANLTGYAVGFCCSYGLNRLWTFADRGAVSRSLWRFALVCAVAYGANLMVLFAARGAMGPETFLPHVAGSITYTVVGYLGSRYFAFKKMSGIRLTDATTSI